MKGGDEVDWDETDRVGKKQSCIGRGLRQVRREQKGWGRSRGG
jgi:hypothetical protein